MERELWRELSLAVADVARSRRSGPRFTHDTAAVVKVQLWAVLHDRPTCWACRASNGSGVTRPPALPSQPTMSRRLRTPAVRRFMAALSRRLAGARGALFRRMDGKALAVARHSKDPEAKLGRGVGTTARGYKLHAVAGEGAMPEAFLVTPLNLPESKVARLLVRRLGGEGYRVADAGYEDSRLYDLCAGRGLRLVTPRRRPHTGRAKGRAHSPARLRAMEMLEPGPNRPCRFGAALVADRGRIERDFAHLGGFGGGLCPLPPFVRRLRRVRLWVHAKLLINAARIRLRNRRGGA